MHTAREKQDTRLLLQAIRALGQQGNFYETELLQTDDPELQRHVLDALARGRDPEAETASAFVRAPCA